MEKENELLPVNIMNDEKPKAKTTIELDRDKMINHVLTSDNENADESPLSDVSLTEAQLNTIIVALGLLPMDDIVEDAEEDYIIDGDLAPNHDVYDYLMHIHDGVRLKAESEEG